MTSKDTYYVAEYVPNPGRSAVWKEIVGYLSGKLDLSGSVVDLGAGYCDFINNIPASVRYAVDISPELSRHAAAGVTCVNAPAWDLHDISDSTIDVVHASNLFEHFTDEELERVVAGVRRVLKPSGKLILLQPNYKLSYRDYFDDPTHKKAFSDISLGVFLTMHGFKVLLKRPRFLPFSMRSRPSLIPDVLIRPIVWAYIRSPFKPFAGQMLFIASKDESTESE
jgi:SAM-dependent methyltransferase